MPTGIGRLIALCGIDASGKTTQTDLLRERLTAEGFSVEQVSFPRYGQSFFADLIERYLRGEFAAEAGKVSPYLAALPYACDRWQAAPQLRAWLQAGRVVLCNRYVAANLAHQGSKLTRPDERRQFYRWNLELEHEVFGLPSADLNVLLDMPSELALELVRRRNAETGAAENHDIHEADAQYLSATGQAYREIARETPERWATVSCTEQNQLLPPRRIAARVWEAARRVLYTNDNTVQNMPTSGEER